MNFENTVVRKRSQFPNILCEFFLEQADLERYKLS